MLDFENARETMVDCQIRPSDVTSHALLEAVLSVPRERFVPEAREELAYIDEDIEVGNGRFLMEPAPFAKLVQALQIGSEDVVLDVGCATGYSSAVLSRMASTVIALEEDADLAKKAAVTLDELDYDNIAVVNAKLTAGCPDEAPFDAILFNGAVESLPQTFLDQLKDGGRLVVVEGRGNAAQARLYLRSGDDIGSRVLFNSAVMSLPGFEKKPEFVL